MSDHELREAAADALLSEGVGLTRSTIYADRVIAALRTCLAEKPELIAELGLPSYVPRIIEAMKELQRRRDTGEAPQVDNPELLDERLRSLGWVRADERPDA